MGTMGLCPGTSTNWGPPPLKGKYFRPVYFGFKLVDRYDMHKIIIAVATITCTSSTTVSLLLLPDR
jgi:hypothetical protein